MCVQAHVISCGQVVSSGFFLCGDCLYPNSIRGLQLPKNPPGLTQPPTILCTCIHIIIYYRQLWSQLSCSFCHLSCFFCHLSHLHFLLSQLLFTITITIILCSSLDRPPKLNEQRVRVSTCLWYGRVITLVELSKHNISFILL